MNHALRILGLVALAEAILLMTATLAVGIALLSGLAHVGSTVDVPTPDPAITQSDEEATQGMIECVAPDGSVVQVPTAQCIDGKYVP